MRIIQTINSTFGVAFGAAGCYAIGYAYGAMCRVNKTLAARAFAVTIATKLTFNILTNIATGGKTKNKTAFYATHLVGDAVFAALHILAFRHLNLMGKLGTAFFSFSAFIVLLENLHGLKNA